LHWGRDGVYFCNSCTNILHSLSFPPSFVPLRTISLNLLILDDSPTLDTLHYLLHYKATHQPIFRHRTTHI
jgi:hypothetical protein